MEFGEASVGGVLLEFEIVLREHGGLSAPVLDRMGVFSFSLAPPVLVTLQQQSSGVVRFTFATRHVIISPFL